MIKTILLVLAVLSMIVLSFIGYKWFKIKNSKNYAEMIDQLVPNDIPYIYEDQIKELSSATILDVRSESEFKVSHLEHAIHIDYEGWNLESVNFLAPNDTIILYCSVGYRSYKIAKKLKSNGFKHVYNLYGGIFEWINQGQKLMDNKGNGTRNIHGYSKNWGKWIKKGNVVYDN